MSARSTRLGGCIAAAALSLAPLCSAVEASSSASLSGFGWTLIDLDPADGIVPAITIRDARAASWSQRVDGPAPVIDWKNGFNSTEVAQLTGSARTRFSATNADAWTAADNGTSMFYAYNTRSFVFDITPRTAIEFFGQAEVASSVPGSKRTYGSVELRSILYGTVVRPLPPNTSPIGGLLLALDTSDGDASRWLSGRMTSGDSAAGGTFELHARSGVNLVPVPEPAGWAMLLAGLAIIGRCARRPVRLPAICPQKRLLR